MEATTGFLESKRYSVVTGGNRGLGFEICRQLASNGITVVLTSRDEKRGLEAVDKLKQSGLSDFVIFHQLDVTDPSSIASLADSIKTQFGKLDILVNNAGYIGVEWTEEFVSAVKTTGAVPNEAGSDWNKLSIQTPEMATECLKINYYGAKCMVETLIHLLQLSDSPKIVNVSSVSGLLKNISNEWAKTTLIEVENLTEEKIDEILSKFMKDFEQGSLEKEGWRPYLSAYCVSKAALNAYTRLLAKRYPDMLINAVCPGSAKTDFVSGLGLRTASEAAQFIVRLALLPQTESSGLFYSQSEISSF